MDILNWLYLAKNKFVRTTLSSAKDLMIFGAKVGVSKRGDIYQNYAMSAEDFTTGITDVVKPYKVYTALLGQSGGSNVAYINWDDDPNKLTVGVTYTIMANDDNSNFIPNGAPNNNVGTRFVATSPVVDWGTGNTGDNYVSYDTGAPVVTVLENTIGNIFYQYGSTGYYNLITEPEFLIPFSKTVGFIGSVGDDSASPSYGFLRHTGEDRFSILTQDSSNTDANGILLNTPIEIRVYN